MPIRDFLNGPDSTANTTPMFATRPKKRQSLDDIRSTFLSGQQTMAPRNEPNTTGLDGKPFYSPAPIFEGSRQSAQTQGGEQSQQVDLYAKYRDPKTGEVMSPEEYSIYLGSRVPRQKGAGTIPQYAGDAMTRPDESAETLTTRARNMMNERNDIATGTTDPYGAASGSDLAYSPQELEAIEKAYAGIYDPALNDVFARLKTREDEAKRKADREDKIFSTNESIRQWKATTGTKSSSSGVDDIFTDANIKTGASRAGMSINEFKSLDSDIKNYFVNPPKIYDSVEEKNITVEQAVTNMMNEYEAGDLTKEEVIELIQDMNLTPSVQTYLINKMPILSEEEKQGILARIWQGVKDVGSAIIGI